MKRLACLLFSLLSGVVLAQSVLHVSPRCVAPTLNFTASSTHVLPGQSVVLSWNSTNTTYCHGSWTNSALKTIGTFQTNSLALNSDLQYSIDCNDSNGDDVSATVDINVSNPPPQGDLAGWWTSTQIPDQSGNTMIADSWGNFVIFGIAGNVSGPNPYVYSGNINGTIYYATVPNYSGNYGTPVSVSAQITNLIPGATLTLTDITNNVSFDMAYVSEPGGGPQINLGIAQTTFASQNKPSCLGIATLTNDIPALGIYQISCNSPAMTGLAYVSIDNGIWWGWAGPTSITTAN